MGLQFVELVVATEETFGISIPDEATQTMRTPRDLANFIVSELPKWEGASCATQRVFNVARRAACDVLGCERRHVRPATKWRDLIPIHRMRSAWIRLGTAVGAASWPRLRRPTWVKVGIAISAGCVASLLWLTGGGLFFAGGAGAAAALVAGIATRPLQLLLPQGCETVGGTVRYVASRWPGKDPTKMWSSSEVETSLKKLITEHLEVTDFTMDTEFRTLVP